MPAAKCADHRTASVRRARTAPCEAGGGALAPLTGRLGRLSRWLLSAYRGGAAPIRLTKLKQAVAALICPKAAGCLDESGVEHGICLGYHSSHRGNCGRLD